ncbi:SDR family NAD(P)-dependent oxidoreductase [Catenovulum sp. 2E275]|uniref:SDR family NAD(P)-dependent oxidoreductase n=1 Tax=Catenovulum sp. 2E275 TaxID=2980497 RepID=UPI0021CF98AA|nr:SDR family NAD(P)-dependent oxidoreductase [Catenovulum sp. 2E275]MCU4676131.1 SDR family NAD(P)-dependent oxidoreductase [Catenovulum sp. 2E275]
MTNKTVLITGCSSGIGFYCAKTLHQAGYQVLATVRNPNDVNKLTDLGILCHPLDLADPSSVETGFNWAVAQADNHQIDVLFNNGAYALPGALEDISRDMLQTQFQTNVFGWHQLTQLCIAHMLPFNSGRIIQNSSVLGFVAMRFRGPYNASKFAIEGLTDTLRLELADTQIQISLIEPGPILSRFRANALAQFEQNINLNNSRFKHTYQNMLSRLKKEGPGMRFTLGPEAVYDKLIHAIEAKRAKPRYYVTFPTHLMGVLKRILPTSWLDALLKRS